MHICSKCNLAWSSGTAALEEDAQLLKVIEAYCTSAKTRQTLNSSKYTHNVTHWHTVRCLTNNDFSSAVILTLCLSCLFSLPFPTIPLNVIWFFPYVLTLFFNIHCSCATILPKSFALPLIPNIRSNPFLLHCGPAWQGTDLMHNHVLADNSLTVAGFPGNPPCSDQSEDSDYDSIWTATSYRTASFSRKIFGSKSADLNPCPVCVY